MTDQPDDNTMILILTVCDLLGKSTSPQSIGYAFKRAQESLQLSRSKKLQSPGAY
jgi:hypothetical protein